MKSPVMRERKENSAVGNALEKQTGERSLLEGGDGNE